MAVTADQYDAILARLTKIESTINDLIVAVNQQVTLNQVHQLLTITQTDLDSIRQDVESLETRVRNIEQDPTG